MKKCMEYRVEGRRPRKTWLESVETDMAELEIGKENVNVMKKRSNPIRKQTNKIIYKWCTGLCDWILRTFSLVISKFTPSNIEERGLL